MKKAKKPINVRELRLSLGVNQAEFWGAIGMTQSAGSRYENDRAMPAPVAKLVDARYVTKVLNGDQLAKLGSVF